MATRSCRRIAGALSALLLALVAAMSLASPANAEDGYRYWNYFHLENGKWAFSQVGVADHNPDDGAVEGFRFGTSTPSKGIEPRADLAEVSFETVCGDTEAAEGEKRVAVVLDFGAESGQGTPPAPRAECAVVEQSATTQQVLDEVAEVRAEKAMLCALDGYPATGCGEPVKDAEVATDEQPVSFALPSDAGAGSEAGGDTEAASAQQDDDSRALWTALGVGALVLLIAAAALVMNRRSRAA